MLKIGDLVKWQGLIVQIINIHDNPPYYEAQDIDTDIKYILPAFKLDKIAIRYDRVS